MKIFYLRYIVFLFLLSLQFGCNNMDLAKNLPKEIAKIIKEVKDNSCLDEVYSYTYKNETVYFFIYPCPEGCYVLRNDKGEILMDSDKKPTCYCDWGGAFCSDDFWENRKDEKLVWKRTKN